MMRVTDVRLTLRIWKKSTKMTRTTIHSSVRSVMLIRKQLKKQGKQRNKMSLMALPVGHHLHHQHIPHQPGGMLTGSVKFTAPSTITHVTTITLPSASWTLQPGKCHQLSVSTVPHVRTQQLNMDHSNVGKQQSFQIKKSRFQRKKMKMRVHHHQKI